MTSMVFTEGDGNLDTRLSNLQVASVPNLYLDPLVSPYSVSTGATGAQNLGTSQNGMIKLMTDSAAVKQMIQFPAGTYNIDMNVITAWFAVAGSLIIQGAGRDATILQFGPNVPTFVYHAFLIQAGAKFELRDIDLRGPVSAGTAGTANLHTSCIHFQPGAQPIDIRIVRCRIDGQWYQGISHDAGAGATATVKITLIGTEISGVYYNFVSLLSTNNDDFRLFISQESEFHDQSIASGHTGAASAYLFDLAPNVSLKMAETDIYGASVGAYGLAYTSGVGSVTNAPFFASLTGVSTRLTVGTTIQTSPNGQALISDCQFLADQCLEINGDTNLSACTIRRASNTNSSRSLIFAGQNIQANSRIQVEDSLIDLSGAGNLATGIGPLTYASVQGVSWIIKGNTFECSPGLSSNLIAGTINGASLGSGLTDGSLYPLLRVLFSDNWIFTNGTDSIFGISWNTDWTLQNNHVIGPLRNGGTGDALTAVFTLITVNNGAGGSPGIPTRALRMFNNEFDLSGGVANTDGIFRQTSTYTVQNDAAWAGFITGSGNQFHGGKFHLSFNVDTHLLQIRAALSPTTIASAATINIDPDFDAYHISGVTTISNINMGNSAGAGAGATKPALKFFNGARIRLIMDSTAAFDAAGNVIATAGASVAGRMREFMYDAPADRWREAA